MKVPKISIYVIARILFIAVTYANQLLVALGLPVIPIDDPTSQNVFSWVLTFIATLIAFWWDNDITIKARVRKLLGKRAQAQKYNE